MVPPPLIDKLLLTFLLRPTAFIKVKYEIKRVDENKDREMGEEGKEKKPMNENKKKKVVRTMYKSLPSIFTPSLIAYPNPHGHENS